MSRYWLAILTCVVLLLSTTLHAGDAIEGTTWKAKLAAASSDGKDFDDTLIFKGGQFSAASMLKRGFKSVAYDDNTVRMGPATFTADSESPTDGKQKWSGTITADQMNGQMVWTKKDGTAITYTLSAERTAK